MPKLIGKDTFGTPMHEGDTIEYFDWCYANNGRYIEDKNWNADISSQRPGFEQRAIAKGYTAKYRSNFGKAIHLEMYKPCKGVVRWSQKHLTYAPIIDCEDFTGVSFLIMIRENEKTGAYCKVIKKG